MASTDRQIEVPAEVDSVSPPRNFSLSTAERVNAAIADTPAFAHRLRTIEDLHARLARRLCDLTSDQPAVRHRFAADLTELNELIDRHNRYYPIERDLPLDPRTGAPVDRGRAWGPLAPVTVEQLRADELAHG